MPTTFNGQVLIQPQVRAAFNTTALTPLVTPSPSPHTLVLIGPSPEGPNSLVTVTSPATVTAALGPSTVDLPASQVNQLADAALLALNPSPDTTGAAPLQVWNVNPTTTASATLADASAVAQISGSTTRWGTPANNIKWSVATGSTSGYSLTIADDQSGDSYTANNLALTPGTIAYTGTELTDVTITVTDTSATVSAGATPSAVFSVSFTTAATVAQFANQVNQQADFVFTVSDPNPNDPTEALFDNVTGVAVTSAATALTANVTAVVRWINSGAQPLVTATRAANATSLATPGTFAYFAGGTTGTAANSDWQDAYTALQAQSDVLWVVPISPSSTIWAMNQAHCALMHSLGHGRSGAVGGSANTAVADAVSAAASLASRYTQYIWQGWQQATATGATITYPPNVVAAAHAAMHAGQPLDQSTTFVRVNAIGLDQTAAPPVIDQLVQAGVVVVRPQQGGFVVVKDQTTAAVNPTATADAVQAQAVNETFAIEALIQQALQVFVGKPITTTTAARVQSTLATLFQTLATPPHPLIFTAPSLANIGVAIDGTVISVQAPVSPTLVADFVTVLLSASVDTASA